MQHERDQLNQFVYDGFDGEGIHVYALDTGVNVAHVDFENRAIVDANFVATENEHDLGGHGIYNKSSLIK
jgi:subtilisin family serine protease